MNDRRKVKRMNGENTIPEVVDNLLVDLRTGLGDYGLLLDEWSFGYHIDIGLLVKIPSSCLPPFPVGGTWLNEILSYDWLVSSIEYNHETKRYDVVFMLEEEI